VVFVKPVNCRDVGMVQRCKEFGLAFKPGQPLSILRKLLRQCLDGDFTTELRVLRPPHFAHTALSKGRNDFIVCKL
jgi:hypothetical protein